MYKYLLLRLFPKERASNAAVFYGLAADRQEYCFTKDFILFFLVYF